MRYAEQLKYSWGYHWSVFREIWDMFTLRNLRWLFVGLLAGLCVMPSMIYTIIPTSTISYFTSTPVPSFAPSLTQELAITEYCYNVRATPSMPAVIGYYWVRSSSFKLLTNVLCLVSVGSLMATYLREGSPVRGREEQK